MNRYKHLFSMICWVGAAIIFNVFILLYQGEKAAIEFMGGYIIELTLSLDNLFLFLMIFSSFGIREIYQERVLKYGIIGAIILRFIFIMFGISIVDKFHWILNLFGVFLLLSGIKMIFEGEENTDFKDSKIIRIIGKIIPYKNKVDGEKFFIKEKGKFYATPLFLILILIEGSDLIFAFDSIPAIFSITTNPLIVYTSNIFAILGLRSMYYLLVRINNKFKYMKMGVAFVVIFTGMKLIALYFGIAISTVVSVLIICIIMLFFVLVSLLIA
ncbi:MAG: TerC/Alx family metal homeostasis membrane protein [Clostridium sp.]